MNNRRRFMIAVPLLLGACTNNTTTSTGDSLLRDVGLIDAGLQGIVATLQALPAEQRPPSAVIGQIKALLEQLHANVVAVGSSLAPNKDALSNIGTIVSAISVLATPFYPAAPLVGAAIQAALALLPVIMAIVNKPAPAAMPFGALRMHPSQARLVLKAAADAQ